MSDTTYMPQVLVDLEARAGASDTDRPAWLAERRGGCTATEVRDLYIRAKSKAKLIATKTEQEAEKDLGAFIPRIRYGKEREPVIAEMLRGEGFVPESRVFHHPENTRHLASPDGIRVDFDENLEVLEIKTDEHGMKPGKTADRDSEAFRASGYRIQVNWVMYVLGARRCRIAIEECVRLADGTFEPGEVHRYWIERDDDLIAELVTIADEFLAELDHMIEHGIDPVAVVLLEEAIASKKAADAARIALEAYCASTGMSSLRIPEGSLSYSTPAPKKQFREALFKAAHPSLAEEFTETVPAAKPTLRVTPTREKKTETEEAS
ncbi:YqaJ viral recombinase family protein [Microbacterium sp. QXD-8]|uniref:YqaJ viral recombinase family protein n=1 Tax=Microbacterium psychrotolerans TaxID=3068321 RepID=A0ABU0YYC0_9MICO|nr:YqaJ viral recombinase family protein [Microbacterium sp. QXD-8]MDQ7877329.1 YqaJ viral recombinase family protein [Microbacterium sp. QXD-8]